MNAEEKRLEADRNRTAYWCRWGPYLSDRDPEFELADIGIFNNNEYFDVFVEYAKKSDEDIAFLR